MKKLRQMREKKGITASELGRVIGTDRFMISKFENDVCLPILKMAISMCNFFDCNILDLCDSDEIYFKPQNLIIERQKKSTNVNIYNFCARADKECCNLLQQDNLIKLGYKNKKDWFIKQVERFGKDLARFEKFKTRQMENNKEVVNG